VYEWEQNLTEMNIWVQPPPGILSPLTHVPPCLYHNQTFFLREENCCSDLPSLSIKGVKANMYDIKITTDHITLGIKGVPDKYFNHDLVYKIDVDESFWTVEDLAIFTTSRFSTPTLTLTLIGGWRASLHTLENVQGGDLAVCFQRS